MDNKNVELDLVYKYRKWRDFFAFCEPNIVYPIKPDRKDREELIEALKQLHDKYGIVHFMHDYSGFMRLDPNQYIKETLDYLESLEPDSLEALNKSYNAYIAPQSDFLPSDGINIPPTENNRSESLKTSQNENNKIEEDDEF